MMPQANTKALPEFPGTPPVGVGVKMSATGLESHLVVPAAALDGIAAYIQQLLGWKRSA